jgi:hypothetical protein
MSTGEVTTMEAESTAVGLVTSTHASLAGTGTGARDPPHAVVNSVAIVTTPNDRSKTRGRTHTEPANSPKTSAPGALTFQLLELRSYGRDVAIERGLVTCA